MTRYKDGDKIITIAKQQGGVWKAGYYSASGRFMSIAEKVPPCTRKVDAQRWFDDWADANGLRVYDEKYEELLKKAGY